MTREEPVAVREQRMAEAKAKSFQDYMAKAETKLLLSMVPQLDNPDLLQTLLRGAYDAGHGAGQGNILIEMVGAMFAKPKAEGRGPFPD